MASAIATQEKNDNIANDRVCLPVVVFFPEKSV